MSNLKYKIIAYLGKKPDFHYEVSMENDGTGAKIAFWSDSLEKSKPTDDELNALETEATKLKNNAIAIANRQKEYGSVSSQIEFITEKGLEAWKTNVQSIKTKYPKESE